MKLVAFIVIMYAAICGSFIGFCLYTLFTNIIITVNKNLNADEQAYLNKECYKRCIGDATIMRSKKGFMLLDKSGKVYNVNYK